MTELLTLAGYTLLLPAAVLLWLFYRFFIRIYLEAARYKKMDPTLKVFVSPMSGLLKVQRQCLEKHGDSHWFVKQMMRENPDQKAYLSNLGDKTFLIVTDTDLVREICLEFKNYHKFKVFKHVDLCYLRGIFFAEGADWKMQRALIGPAFNHEHLEHMIPIMMKTSKEAMQRLHAALPKNDVLAVLYETQTIIGEILVRTFFSNEITQKQVNGKNLSLALADFSSFNFYNSRSPVNLLMILLFGTKARNINFTKSDKELLRTLEQIRKVVFGIVEERIAGKGRDERDFMNLYIGEMEKREQQYSRAVAEGTDTSKIQRISKEDILQQLLSFYFAGIDTTGHLLAFALYCSAEYPDCYQKLENEINSIIKTQADITYDNIKKLDYAEMFLKECLRMWPPAVGILTRETVRDVQLGPYHLKKGSLVGTNLLGLMHNPKYYRNPEKFDPERWSDNDSLSGESYAYIPFSAGPRSCIGKHMAMLEAKVILTYFLKFFKLSRTELSLRVHCIFLYEPLEDKLVRLAAKEDKQNSWAESS